MEIFSSKYMNVELRAVPGRINRICCCFISVTIVSLSSPSVSISPVSREEQASAQEFSPVTEEHVMELDAHARHSTQTAAYTKEQASSGVGDLNKNLLIQACSAQSSEASQLMCSVGPSKLDVQ